MKYKNIGDVLSNPELGEKYMAVREKYVDSGKFTINEYVAHFKYISKNLKAHPKFLGLDFKKHMKYFDNYLHNMYEIKKETEGYK